MIQDFSQIEKITQSMLKSANLLDVFSFQEKQRFGEFLLSAMSEFNELHPISSYPDAISAQDDAKLFLISELDQIQDVFGIKDLSKKINLDEFLKEYFNQEFSSK